MKHTNSTNRVNTPMLHQFSISPISNAFIKLPMLQSSSNKNAMLLHLPSLYKSRASLIPVEQPINFKSYSHVAIPQRRDAVNSSNLHARYTYASCQLIRPESRFNRNVLHNNLDNITSHQVHIKKWGADLLYKHSYVPDSWGKLIRKHVY